MGCQASFERCLILYLVKHSKNYYLEVLLAFVLALPSKLSLPFIAGLASVAFVVFRAAIFDAQILAPWSPLKIDDASFTSDLKRKDRREALGENKRLDMFLRENFYVLNGFGGAMLISNLVQ